MKEKMKKSCMWNQRLPRKTELMGNDLLWIWQPGTPAMLNNKQPCYYPLPYYGHTVINTPDKVMPVEKQRSVFPSKGERKKEERKMTNPQSFHQGQ